MFDVLRADRDRRLRLIKLILTQRIQPGAWSILLRGIHRELQQPARPCGGFGQRFETAFLTYQRENKTRIEFARFRGTEYRLSIRRWIRISHCIHCIVHASLTLRNDRRAPRSSECRQTLRRKPAVVRVDAIGHSQVSSERFVFSSGFFCTESLEL